MKPFVAAGTDEYSIGTQIFIGMAIGAVVGFWMGPAAANLKPGR